MAESGTSGAGGAGGANGTSGSGGAGGAGARPAGRSPGRVGGSQVWGPQARGSRARGARGSGAATDPDLPAAVLDQWRAVADHLDGLADTVFAAPSALPGWTTAELAIHTAGSALSLSEALAGRRGGADRARTLAADRSPDLVRATFRDAVADVAADLADLAPLGGDEVADRLVGTPGGIMRLGEFLLTRAVEAVVHGLDLGVTPRRPALKAVVKLFTAVLVERAPGRSVELRVPPFSAVQIVEGPRHTRGTPPNVVEADAEAFVLVATGRLAWESAVGDGRIRASGERADLRRLLPLLA